MVKPDNKYNRSFFEYYRSFCGFVMQQSCENYLAMFILLFLFASCVKGNGLTDRVKHVETSQGILQSSTVTIEQSLAKLTTAQQNTSITIEVGIF